MYCPDNESERLKRNIVYPELKISILCTTLLCIFLMIKLLIVLTMQTSILLKTTYNRIKNLTIVLMRRRIVLWHNSNSNFIKSSSNLILIERPTWLKIASHYYTTSLQSLPKYLIESLFDQLVSFYETFQILMNFTNTLALKHHQLINLKFQP